MSAVLRKGRHDVGPGVLLPSYARRSAVGRVVGFVSYEILHVEMLANAVSVDLDQSAPDMWWKVRYCFAESGEKLVELARQWLPRGFATPSTWGVHPKLAVGVAKLGWPLLHVVAFGGKLDRRQLIDEFPSRRTLNQYRPCVGEPDVDDPIVPAEERIGVNPFGGKSASTILRWVEATSYIKALKDSESAALSFAKVLNPGDQPQSIHELLKDEDIAGTDTLRKARVRLDLMAMLAFRLAYPRFGQATFVVWTDSSPQWRGLEYCASSFEMFLPTGVGKRRLLPCLSLTRGRTSALQKTLALLWQICLIVGPSELQGFCKKIRGIVTDMGTERLIPRMPIQVLSSFLNTLIVTFLLTTALRGCSRLRYTCLGGSTR